MAEFTKTIGVSKPYISTRKLQDGSLLRMQENNIFCLPSRENATHHSLSTRRSKFTLNKSKIIHAKINRRKHISGQLKILILCQLLTTMTLLTHLLNNIDILGLSTFSGTSLALSHQLILQVEGWHRSYTA